MGPIHINPQDLQTIATSCRNSGENMTTEATNIRAQIERLHDALQGVPHLGLADHFNDLNRIFSQVSDEIEQCNTYLNDVVAKVNDFVTSLGRA